jgi:hypothetical protein
VVGWETPDRKGVLTPEFNQQKRCLLSSLPRSGLVQLLNMQACIIPTCCEPRCLSSALVPAFSSWKSCYHTVAGHRSQEAHQVENMATLRGESFAVGERTPMPAGHTERPLKTRSCCSAGAWFHTPPGTRLRAVAIATAKHTEHGRSPRAGTPRCEADARRLGSPEPRASTY